ncbi:enoyl-CoA hydratase/isomerase family protein [Rhodococcus sp. OK302]|uniref:enoyl-CoA hydratase/isomerase family protein n=1 Tax=Rhodococcus sp. OK302 TaxID=1882769 RepID=UPI000B942FA9|nr:enoyl-CoA hydratase/isomerase family protein [Rhodococcus sp. OK302]OYD67029.1 enoyl-CoA hydratase [Rhodococcus sp. OK302]
MNSSAVDREFIYGNVAVTVHAATAVVTLMRPDRLNALTAQVSFDLERSLRRIGGDSSTRVVVLTGSGRSFCAGMDLDSTPGAGVDGDPVQAVYQDMRTATSVVIAMREIRQPVIAAVRGNAVGAGFAFAAASDIRICSSDALFSAMFVKIGMSPGDLGLSWILPRLIGHGRAAELFYRGGALDAATAQEWGFTGTLAEDPLQSALELAEEMGSRPPLGIAMCKELLNSSLGWSGFREHLELELRSQVIGLLTADHRDAVQAFHNGRSRTST